MYIPSGEMALATMACPGREKSDRGQLVRKKKRGRSFISFFLSSRATRSGRGSYPTLHGAHVGMIRAAGKKRRKKNHPLRTTAEVSRDLEGNNLTESVVPTKMGGLLKKI